MGKHLEMLEGFVNECSPSLQKFVVSAMSQILTPSHYDFSKLEPSEEDDLLTALQKKETLSKTPMKDLPGYTTPTWRGVKDAILWHGKDQLLGPFLVTSLVLVVDENLQYYADEEVGKQGAKNSQRTVKFLEEQKHKDSPENANDYDEQLRFFQSNIDTWQKTVSEHQALLSEWRKIIGDRWRTRRHFGMWEDVDEYELPK